MAASAARTSTGFLQQIEKFNSVSKKHYITGKNDELKHFLTTTSQANIHNNKKYADGKY